MTWDRVCIVRSSSSSEPVELLKRHVIDEFFIENDRSHRFQSVSNLPADPLRVPTPFHLFCFRRVTTLRFPSAPSLSLSLLLLSSIRTPLLMNWQKERSYRCMFDWLPLVVVASPLLDGRERVLFDDDHVATRGTGISLARFAVLTGRTNLGYCPSWRHFSSGRWRLHRFMSHLNLASL